MNELQEFEKYAADTYESIARYEALPTKPYKSLEVEAAHDAWMARAMLDGWQLFETLPEDNEKPLLAYCPLNKTVYYVQWRNDAWRSMGGWNSEIAQEFSHYFIIKPPKD